MNKTDFYDDCQRKSNFGVNFIGKTRVWKNKYLKKKLKN